MDKHVWFPPMLVLIILMSFLSYSYGQLGCTYVIKTQTANVRGAGTSGKVSISLCWNSSYCFLNVPDIAQYGASGPLYSYYFQEGRYSYFNLRTSENCASTCQVKLGLDGAIGDSIRSQWLVDSVEVEALNTWGTSLYNIIFPFYGWLNPSEEVTVNRCLQYYGCNYEVWVRTGDQHNATTNGTVSLTLSDSDGQSVVDVSDLAKYGVKGPLATDYFAARSHSLFIISTYAETCSNPCNASVTHTGDAWFLESIVVSIYNANTFQYKEPFKFHQWIDGEEITTVDNCKGELRAIA